VRKRVLLTGGTGFVGANLARRLLADGHDVHLLVRHSYSPWRIEAIRSDLHLHESGLGDVEQLGKMVKLIGPEWVFHLAAHGAYPDQTDLATMMQTNLVGTINLVEASLRVGFESFVNTGSSSEYGFKDHAPSEIESLEPNSNYAFTKASATLFCQYVARAHSVHLCTLRLYSVYGPFEEPTRLVPTLITCGLSGRLPPLANPATARDYVFTDDVSEAYVLAASRHSQERGAVYNVGTGRQTSLREVVDTASRLIGIQAEPQWASMPGRAWDSATWVSDSQKARRELGWKPRYPLEEGLSVTLDWFRSEPSILPYYLARSAAPSSRR
jgi:nucleoside-diphosphate-sugar epimerase